MWQAYYLPGRVTNHIEDATNDDIEYCNPNGCDASHQRHRPNGGNKAAGTNSEEETANVPHLRRDERATLDFDGHEAVVPRVLRKELLNHWILQKGI